MAGWFWLGASGAGTRAPARGRHSRTSVPGERVEPGTPGGVDGEINAVHLLYEASSQTQTCQDDKPGTGARSLYNVLEHVTF